MPGLKTNYKPVGHELKIVKHTDKVARGIVAAGKKFNKGKSFK